MYLISQKNAIYDVDMEFEWNKEREDYEQNAF